MTMVYETNSGNTVKNNSTNESSGIVLSIIAHYYEVKWYSLRMMKDFVIAVMESQNQDASHGPENGNMPLMQKELLAKMQEMMNLMLQNKEGQQPVSNPVETSSKLTGDRVMHKLAKFKKFAPVPFKEAKDSNDAEE